MKLATEDAEELKRCIKRFERRERSFYSAEKLQKTRRKNGILPPGKGLYLDAAVNDRWMTWRDCWDFLVS
jgi:hypothetical protein